MSMTSLEVKIPQSEQGLFVRERRFLQPHDEQFEEWLTIRHEFMARKGWRTPEAGEWDEYDETPETAHVVLYGEGGRLLFGMRLTPIDSVDASMSWRMVADSNIHEQVTEHERTLAPLPVEGLWDLTRLVPGEHIRSEESHEAIPRLFHEGLMHCQKQGDANPAWVFALDKVTHRWLTSQGVAVSILGRDHVGADKQETLFGLVYPAEIDQANGDFAQRSRKGAS